MKESNSKVENVQDYYLVGYCKKCKVEILLQEFLRKFRNGAEHVEGRCPICNCFVKFIPHGKSFLINKGSTV